MRNRPNITKIILYVLLGTLLFGGRVYAADINNDDRTFTDAVRQLPSIELLRTTHFYKVQQLRDRLVERLLVIPQIKLEYYLVMSEKKLHEYIILISKGQMEKGIRSGSEGSNYLTKFVSTLLLYQPYLQSDTRDHLVCSFFHSAQRQRAILTYLRDRDQQVNIQKFEENLLTYLSMHENKLHSIFDEMLYCTTIGIK
jgi:hypothetical protein